MDYDCNASGIMTQPKRRTQEERSAATRNKLIDATIDLLMEVGLSGCSLAAVARRARMTTGALQHQFSTRAHLMRAVIAERLFRTDRHIDLDSRHSGTLDDRCRELVRVQWQIYGSPKYMAIWEIIFGSRSAPEIKHEIVSWQRDATRIHQALLAESFADLALDEPMLRSIQYFLNAQLRGLALLRTVEDERADISEQLDMLIDMLVAYLAKKRAPELLR